MRIMRAIRPLCGLTLRDVSRYAAPQAPCDFTRGTELSFLPASLAIYVSRAKKRYQVLEIEILAVPDTLEFSASNKANRLLIALLLPEKMSTKLFQIVPHHA